MKISNKLITSIHVELKKLIEQKSIRDQIHFTGSQLANALNMPRSMITKLTHPDCSKRVVNPRIDTLLKIVDYFRADGFNITIDNLLGIKTNSIDVQNQKIPQETNLRKISLFSFHAERSCKLGTIEMKISAKSENIIALHSDHDIKPLFKKGSIFIIDQDAPKENDTLVAVKSPNLEKIQINKYIIDGHRKLLQIFEPDEKYIVLMPNSPFNIIGTVIQVNAKT